jgi:hypothetical protein
MTAYLHALDPSGNLIPLQADAAGKLYVDVGALAIGDVEIKNDAGNPVPVTGGLTDTQLRASDVKVTLDSETVALAGGTNSIGAVASNSVLSSATITRPADTTPYAAKDVISTAVGAVIEFAGMARAVGGTGTIVKARLMTNQSTNVAQYRLHLFHTAPTPIADNAQCAMLDANKANRVGMIDFPSCATEGTGSDAAATMRPSSDGSYPAPLLWYKCAAADTKLYGILETISAFTPASGQTFFIELGADGLS